MKPSNKTMHPFPIWIRIFLLICLIAPSILCVVLLCSRYDYIYDLPDAILPAYLEVGQDTTSIKKHMTDEASYYFFNLTGVSQADSFFVQEDETIHIALQETIGRVKVAFASSTGELIPVEGSGDITLPAGTYTPYYIGEHFWGEVILSQS